MPKGTIKKLMDKGFGFIKGEEEGDLFFHRNDMDGVEFESLREGQEVEFEKSQDSRGRPQAVKVRLAEPVAEVSAEITPAAELEEKPAKPAARRRARAEPSPEPKVEKVEEAPPKPEGE